MSLRARLQLAAAIAAVAVIAPAAMLAGQSVTPRDAGNRWSVPRTPWGDPDLQGTYTNSHEFGTPLEQPPELAGRRLEDFGEPQMAELRRQRREQAKVAPPMETEESVIGEGPAHWEEHHDANNSQPWRIIDTGGRLPPLVPEAQRRVAARQEARRGRGPADSWEDRSPYDRCITRGLPGSMMPTPNGNVYDVTQAPGHVVIRYEAVHEARVIPLDGSAHVSPRIGQYMGDARGHWDGDTLVVVTTNFRAGFTYRNATETLKITERFTPVDAQTLRWEIRFDDPLTWERPWAFAMQLKKDSSARVFEFACHEGNRGLEYILRAARAGEQSAAASGGK